MNIYVCMKPVPDPDYYNQVTIDPVTKRITREGIPTIINPADKSAIEKAIQLKEKFGGKVIVLSMSTPNTTSNIKEALSMGADEGILLTDVRFGGADTLATSYTLSEALKKCGDADLVLTGNESADGATAQVCSQLGAWMGWDSLWNVSSIESEDGVNFSLKSKLDRGYINWEGRLPMVLGVSKDAAKPRYTSAVGIIKARNKPIMVWSRDDMPDVEDKYIGLEGSPTKAGNIKLIDMSRNATKLEGTREVIIDRVVEIIRAGGINV